MIARPPVESILELFEHYHEGLLWVDVRSLQIVHGNAAARRLLGYDLEQLQSYLVTDIENSIEDVFFWAEVQNGECQPFHGVRGYYRRADGSIFQVEKGLTKIESATVPMLMISFHDAEPERKLEDSLAHSTSLLAATLEATADGVLVTDLNGAIFKMNRLFAQMWRVPQSLLEAGVDAEVFAYMQSHVADGEGYRQRLAVAMELAGDPIFDEIPLIDGRCLERHITPLHINLQLHGHVFSFRDITERKRAELEQRRYEQQLREQNHELEKANQIKSAFLANMSHEIRTPMHAIISLTRLCMGTQLSAQQRDYVQKVYGASKSLLRIIDDILDFAKLESGKVKVERIPFRLQQVFDNLKNLMLPAAQERGLALTLQLDAEPTLELMGDTLRLGQVLLNLVSNALKFTEQGQVAVRAAIIKDEAAAVLIEFSVRDTGIGLSPEQMANLFQSFSQADASTTRKYGGTGLGLAISKQFVELMGGTIAVESALGAGSTFTCRIPFDRAPAGSVPAEISELGESFDPRCLSRARVLVVEDNKINQQIARELLTRAGLSVEIANTGLESLEILEHQTFDAVLMDVQMPVLDGFEATRAVRERLRLTELPIIAMTANAMPGDRERCLAAGMNDYLPKPIEAQALLAALAKWIGDRGAPVNVAALSESPAMHDEPAPTHAALPAALRGFDLPVAIRNADNDPAFLRELLQEFERGHRHDAARIRESLSTGDPDVARRLVHTLKGIGATFGANRLHAAAQAMDARLRSTPPGDCAALLGELTLALDEVLTSIATLGPAEGHAAVA